MINKKYGQYALFAVAGVLLLTGVFKIFSAEEAAKEFGNDTAPYILAVIEFIIATAIIIPKTRLLGVLLAASYFGGAIAFAWLVEGELPIVQVTISTVIYVGAALYRPFLQHNGTAVAD
jgi:hypothetical protein